MSFSIMLLAFGLAADAFAVAIGQGAAAARQNVLRTAFAVALAFGVAQTIAPLIGWALGYWFTSVIQDYDHWIAFGLLLVVGMKMIWEGVRSDPPGEESDPGKLQIAKGWALFMLAVATSIDAAAAGITLPTLDAPLLVSLAVIGTVTFVLSFTGVWLGRAGSNALGSNAEIIGGLILIVIGAKVLIDHKAFG